MKITNLLINRLLSDVDHMQVNILPAGLQKIIDSGFYCFDNLITFNFIKLDSKDMNLEVIKERFYDLSGFEYSHNKIHIEDYCDGNLLLNALLFLNEFEKKWQHDMICGKPFIIIGFEPETEFGQICTFTFHKQRVGESVVNIDNLEKFSNAVLINL